MKLSEKLADQNSDVEFYNGTLADEARALEADNEALNHTITHMWEGFAAERMALEEKLADYEAEDARVEARRNTLKGEKP
jgi:hypothetical protein